MVGVPEDLIVRIHWRWLVRQNIEGRVQQVKGLVICFTVLVFAVDCVGGMAGIPTRLSPQAGSIKRDGGRGDNQCSTGNFRAFGGH